MMRTSEQGRALIEGFEAFAAVAYFDAAGVPTIGFGHTASVTSLDVRNGKTITRAEADALFAGDLSVAEAAVNLYATVQLTQNEFDALVSFTFNEGTGALHGSSLLGWLNSSAFTKAAKAFTLYNKLRNKKTGQLEFSAGLLSRRVDEAFIFLGVTKAS